ncbi:MAG: sigma-70 family RNA polymerase sigma factor [Arenimonas sp.]
MDKLPQPTSGADELLALRCQLGERAAFDELIQHWAPPLRRYVLRMTGDGDAADDLMQEIWIAVIQGMARLREASKLRSWLFGIAHRVLTDRLRARYASPIDFDSDPPDGLSEDLHKEHEQERDEARKMVESGLALMPLPEREVLTLFYLQELSLMEISSVILVPVGTVKSRLFRARNLLRNRLFAQETMS